MAGALSDLANQPKGVVQVRLVKLLCAMSAAAIVVTALVGTTSASATSLCKEKAEVCPAASVYPAGTKIKARLKEGTEAVLESSLGTIRCKGSTAAGETTEESGSPLMGTQTSMTFSECVFQKSTVCTVTIEHLPWLVEGTEIEPGNGFVTISSGGTGTPQAHVVCGSFVNCTWGEEKITLDGEGGSPAIERLLKVALVKISGFLCPTSTAASAEYEITEPQPVFASAKP
jgi:hypothetical protein